MKKLIALLLALIMAFSVVPMNIFISSAAGETYTVKYIDGKNNYYFDAQEYVVEAGQPTPEFDSTKMKQSKYDVIQWDKPIAETVTEDVTYKAVTIEKRATLYVTVYDVTDGAEVRLKRRGGPVESLSDGSFLHNSQVLGAEEVADLLNQIGISADLYGNSKYGIVGFYNESEWNNGQPETTPDSFKVSNQGELTVRVAEWENVVVKAVTNGDKGNAEIIAETKAVNGSNLVSFLAANAEVSEKAGYTLDKWYDWDNYGTKFDESAVVLGDVNVYVTYTVNNYTITLTDSLNGEEYSKTVTFDAAVGELPVPRERLGYRFLGWFDKATGEQYTEDTVYTVAGDVTLTANWEVISGKTYGKLKLTAEEIVYYTGNLPTAKWPHRVAVKLAEICLKLIDIMESARIFNFQGLKDSLYNTAADLLKSAVTEYWANNPRV